jgi:putative acetyltransferase
MQAGINTYIVLVLLLFITHNAMSMHNTIEIKPIEPHQASQVKQLILDCVVELKLWRPENTLQEIEAELDRMNEFSDLRDVQSAYFNNNGMLLVLLDNQKVVGAGGIRRLDDEICELKRVYFLKEYRGRGFGLQMMNQLLDFAKDHNYKKIRLSVLNSNIQIAAVTLYKKLGFYEVESPSSSLRMEKILM